ncbi:MAG: type II secretion system protein [Candidatus Methanomethylicia archaeon]
MLKNKKGFTLLELTIVVAIISILVLVLIPNFVLVRNEAKLSACTSNLKSASTIIENYALDNRDLYPTNSFIINENEPIIKPYYLTHLECPTSKLEYEYIPNSSSNSYWIYCPTYNNPNKHKTPRGIIKKVYFDPKQGLVKEY